VAAYRQHDTIARPAAELTPQLEVIAKRVAWWKTPCEALANTDDFLCRVMTFGLWDDMVCVIRIFGEDAMRHALNNAPAGIFDPQSWHYWHYRLGFSKVPEMPQREIK
jgi:hypothetical protein